MNTETDLTATPETDALPSVLAVNFKGPLDTYPAFVLKYLYRHAFDLERRLNAANEKLRQMEKYLSHLPICDYWQNGDCDCGLQDLLEKLK